MIDGQNIQLAFGIDDQYFYPAAVAIFSACKHTEKPLDIHVLSADLSEEHWKQLERLTTQMGGCFFAHIVHPNAFAPPKVNERWSYVTGATYLRLLIPEYMKGRVIYIDCDTLICDDLAEFASIDLENSVFSAIPDQSTCIAKWSIQSTKPQPIRKTRQVRRKKWLDTVQTAEEYVGENAAQNYFNAGVFLLDVDGLAKNSKLAHAFRNFEDIEAKGGANDQDYLNLIFKDRYTHANLRWNAQLHVNLAKRNIVPRDLREEWENARKDPGIIHFTGPKKPWNVLPRAYQHRTRGFAKRYRTAMQELENHFGITK